MLNQPCEGVLPPWVARSSRLSLVTTLRWHLLYLIPTSWWYLPCHSPGHCASLVSRCFLPLVLPWDLCPLLGTAQHGPCEVDTFCPLPGDTWLRVRPEGPAEAEAEALQPADPSCSITHPGMCCVCLMSWQCYVLGNWNHSQPCPPPERNGSFCCASSHGEVALWESTHYWDDRMGTEM